MSENDSDSKSHTEWSAIFRFKFDHNGRLPPDGILVVAFSSKLAAKQGGAIYRMAPKNKPPTNRITACQQNRFFFRKNKISIKKCDAIAWY